MKTGFSEERIEGMLARSRAFWRGEFGGPMVSVNTLPAYRQETEDARIVEGAVACIQADGASGERDVLPCFWPDFGTVTTARMWGGRVIPPKEGQMIHIEPAAKTVADLPGLVAGTFEESDFARALRLWRAVRERFDGERVFVRLPDFQGPMNTLALVMDQQELLLGMYEEPAAIHAALTRVTDVLIACVRRFLDEAGPENVVGMIWPYITLPGDMGVSITQDYMPLLSPQLYAAFEAPQLKRIADAFGGVFIHCCGKYRQHLRTLKEADFKIWGLECAYPQTPPWELYEVFGDEVALLSGVSPDGAERFPTALAYAEHLATLPCAAGRWWFMGSPEMPELAAWRKAVETSFGRERKGH